MIALWEGPCGSYRGDCSERTYAYRIAQQPRHLVPLFRAGGNRGHEPR